jgi:hypothetical protein
MSYWYVLFLLLIWNVETSFCWDGHCFPQYCILYKLMFNEMVYDTSYFWGNTCPLPFLNVIRLAFLQYYLRTVNLLWHAVGDYCCVVRDHACLCHCESTASDTPFTVSGNKSWSVSFKLQFRTLFLNSPSFVVAYSVGLCLFVRFFFTYRSLLSPSQYTAQARNCFSWISLFTTSTNV